jgi:hypothetical protein
MKAKIFTGFVILAIACTVGGILISKIKKDGFESLLATFEDGSAAPVATELKPGTTRHVHFEDSWKGVVNNSTTYGMMAKIAAADEDLLYLTRLDYNDSLVFTNFPTSWRTSLTNTLPPSRAIEWMVPGGQKKHSGEMIVTSVRWR